MFSYEVVVEDTMCVWESEKGVGRSGEGEEGKGKRGKGRAEEGREEGSKSTRYSSCQEDCKQRSKYREHEIAQIQERWSGEEKEKEDIKGGHNKTTLKNK